MRRKNVFFCSLLFVCLCISCSYISHNNKSSLTVSESEEKYNILANYPENNTAKVEQYMNEKIGDRNNLSFVHTTIDAELTLDDGTKFYIKNNPGELEIKMDKDKNSIASYNEIKALGEGLKPFLNK